MEKERARAIIIKDSEVLVIHRINERGNYYVFPGGGIEENETPEEAMIREVREETSLIVQVNKLFDLFTYKTKEYYFLCDYISGEPQLNPESEEAHRQDETNQYNVQWFPISQLDTILLYPIEVRDKLMESLESK